MVNISELKRFDAAEHLDSDEAIAEYLSIVLEENDPDALIHALGTIARARGMTQIAKDAGLGRESLYKALKDHLPCDSSIGCEIGGTTCNSLNVCHRLGCRTGRVANTPVFAILSPMI